MINLKTLLRNKSGFTILELFIAASVGIAVLGLLGVMTRQNSELSKKNRIFLRSQMEHFAFKQLLSGVPSRELTSIFCAYPHPYMEYDSAAQKCKNGIRKDLSTYPAPTAAELASWKKLSATYFEFAFNHVLNRHRTPLYETNFKAVKDALVEAKCTSCHDGKSTAFNATLTRNFSSFSSLTSSPAIISRDAIVSPLGRRLLQTSMTFTSLLMGKVNQADAGTEQVNHSLTLSTAFDDTFCEASDKNITHKDGVEAATLFCPTSCDASNNFCSSLCPSGQYADLTTCIYYCSNVNTDTCSNDVAACLNWRRSLICMAPKLNCSNPSNLSCPAGTTVVKDSCLMNQSHPRCGDGSTTWKCADPNNPQKYAAGIIQYLLSTTVTRPLTVETPALTKTLVSEGALP